MVHATSAVAFAVVALSAASTMALSTTPAHVMLEIRAQLAERGTYIDPDIVGRAPVNAMPANSQTPSAGSIHSDPSVPMATGAPGTPGTPGTPGPGAPETPAGADLKTLTTQSGSISTPPGPQGSIPAATNSASTPSGSVGTQTGPYPTKTITVRPKPTHCKPGETPSVDRKRGGHHKAGLPNAPSHDAQNRTGKSSTPNAEPQLSSTPPVGNTIGATPTASPPVNTSIGVSSSASGQAGVQAGLTRRAIPTSSATPEASPAALSVSSTGVTTPAPTQPSVAHPTGSAASVFKSSTHVGRKDGKTTVYNYVHGTKTRCYDHKPTQRNIKVQTVTKTKTVVDTVLPQTPASTRGIPSPNTSTKSNVANPNSAAIATGAPATDPALVARAAAILARYLNELE